MHFMFFCTIYNLKYTTRIVQNDESEVQRYGQ
uniref:Uncharacterized protein n=1 Tax=virus sp. ctQmo6 TaxID=2827990 RepID=A0A8S5RGF9_9VIRU|nr:MAG TPA: hypothetical protein [virus sp. ctQmo6]